MSKIFKEIQNVLRLLWFRKYSLFRYITREIYCITYIAFLFIFIFDTIRVREHWLISIFSLFITFLIFHFFLKIMQIIDGYQIKITCQHTNKNFHAIQRMAIALDPGDPDDPKNPPATHSITITGLFVNSISSVYLGFGKNNFEKVPVAEIIPVVDGYLVISFAKNLIKYRKNETAINPYELHLFNKNK